MRQSRSGSNRSGRRYDREFRNNAVAMVRGGEPPPKIAIDHLSQSSEVRLRKRYKEESKE